MDTISPEPGLFPRGWLPIALLVVGVLLYRYYTATFGFFRDLGVPYLKPTIFVGNAGGILLMKVSYYEMLFNIYHRFKGFPMAGAFEGRLPLLMLRDPELIKAVMIRDFDHFTDNRDFNLNNEKQLSKLLFRLKGREWKNIRSFVTPVFSNAKLRSMDPLIQQACLRMVQFLKQRPAGDTEVEMKLFTCRYTLDVIGSCAFGIDCASLKNPESEFVRMAEGFMDIPLYERVFFLSVLCICPSILNYVPVTMFNPTTIKYLVNITLKTMRDRTTNLSNRRNDFIQLLADAYLQENTEKKVLNDQLVIGLALSFFIAGFETSSSLLSFTCMTLAHTPELQDRLRKDIQDAVQGGQDRPYYELVNEIPLLEQVLMETMRLYPPLHRIERVCVKPYTFSGTNVTLKVGDVVLIPVAGIMSDAEYYPEPEKFDPERFSPGAKKRQETFLAFGLGPRTCTGMRFAMLTTKLYLLYLLNNFKVLPSDKAQMPITYDKKALLLKSAKGMWVHVEPLGPLES